MPEIDAVILFSHGSLMCDSGRALEQHAERLRTSLDLPVEIGYLNYSEPLFADVVAGLYRLGHRRLHIVPYFLINGYFVKVELKRCIEQSQAQFPKVCFSIAKAMGNERLLCESLIESADAPITIQEFRCAQVVEKRLCKSLDSCPMFGTKFCPATGPEAATIPQSNLVVPDSLLVMVHGTPKPEANDDIIQVVKTVRERKIYDRVDIGYMECNQPDIPTAISAMVTTGAQSVVAVPYFLHTGRHVCEDLPNFIAEAQLTHPHVQFRMGNFIGASQKVTDLLLKRVGNVG